MSLIKCGENFLCHTYKNLLDLSIIKLRSDWSQLSISFRNIDQGSKPSDASNSHFTLELKIDSGDLPWRLGAMKEVFSHFWVFFFLHVTATHLLFEGVVDGSITSVSMAVAVLFPPLRLCPLWAGVAGALNVSKAYLFLVSDSSGGRILLSGIGCLRCPQCKF